MIFWRVFFLLKLSPISLILFRFHLFLVFLRFVIKTSETIFFLFGFNLSLSIKSRPLNLFLDDFFLLLLCIVWLAPSPIISIFRLALMWLTLGWGDRLYFVLKRLIKITFLFKMFFILLIWRNLLNRIIYFNYFDLTNFLILFVIWLEFKMILLIWILKRFFQIIGLSTFYLNLITFFYLLFLF